MFITFQFSCFFVFEKIVSRMVFRMSFGNIFINRRRHYQSFLLPPCTNSLTGETEILDRRMPTMADVAQVNLFGAHQKSRGGLGLRPSAGLMSQVSGHHAHPISPTADPARGMGMGMPTIT